MDDHMEHGTPPAGQSHKGRKQNYVSLAFIILGVLVQLDLNLWPSTLVVGLLMCGVGLAYYAKAHEQSAVWGTLAVLPVIGPIYAVKGIRGREPFHRATGSLWRLQTLLNTPLFLVLFVPSCVTSVSFVARHHQPTTAQEVGADTPLLFPILVMTPGSDNEPYRAHVVFKKDIANFLRENPNYTYLMPDGQDQTLLLHLRTNSRLPAHAHSRIYFKVERQGDGKQYLEVGYPPHEESNAVGWYIASGKDITPKRFRLSHDMGEFMSLLPSSGLAFLSSFVVSFLVYWLLLKRFWPEALKA